MSTFDVNAILSSTAYGSDGDKIGKVEQVFLDDNSGDPTFLTVNTGLFGAKENFVPVKGARQDGDRVVLPYTKDVIKDAPKVDADQHLSPAEEEELYRYYEMNYDDGRAAGERRADDAADRDRLAADRDRDVTDRDRADAGQDRHVAAGENASVTRHEEQLHVDTQEREAGHARLRKYVVTDHETVDVPVEREEVTVERTPLNGTEAHAGTGRIGEEEVDVTLHEERPVVEKETVAVEEVGLNKQTVRETQRVEADVQKEQVDVETDVDRDGLGRDDLGRDGEAPRR